MHAALNCNCQKAVAQNRMGVITLQGRYWRGTRAACTKMAERHQRAQNLSEENGGTRIGRGLDAALTSRVEMGTK